MGGCRVDVPARAGEIGDADAAEDGDADTLSEPSGNTGDTGAKADAAPLLFADPPGPPAPARPCDSESTSSELLPASDVSEWAELVLLLWWSRGLRRGGRDMRWWWWGGF